MLTLDDMAASLRTDQILGLSRADVEARRGYIGASDANTILGGDVDKILSLWRVKRGEEEPEDLSDVLAVQMGTWTESLNLYWYERQTGNKVIARNVQRTHPTLPWLRSRADGETVVDGLDAVLDAKHVGPFGFDLDATIEKYMPQLAVQMACAGYERAILSVFVGNSRWESSEPVARNLSYEAGVLDALEHFWACVKSGVPPVDVPCVEPPLPHSLMRSIDMRTHPAWQNLESEYVAFEMEAKRFEDAKIALKGLVEPDVKLATGHEIKISRDKRGALRISKI